jgi:hypothetical protein
LYLPHVVVRDFHASEFGFNRQHQLNAVEEIGFEIVREVRLACDKLEIHAKVFCNESADIVDGKTFSQRRRPMKRCQATDGHDEAPDSVRARNSFQINAPGSVTLI